VNYTPLIAYLDSLGPAVVLAVWGVVCLGALGLGFALWVALENRIARPVTWLAGKPRDTTHTPTHSKTIRRLPADDEAPAGRHSLGNPDLSQEIPAAVLLAAWAADRAKEGAA
jgi:hypothetical protein